MTCLNVSVDSNIAPDQSALRSDRCSHRALLLQKPTEKLHRDIPKAKVPRDGRDWSKLPDQRHRLPVVITAMGRSPTSLVRLQSLGMYARIFHPRHHLYCYSGSTWRPRNDSRSDPEAADHLGNGSHSGIHVNGPIHVSTISYCVSLLTESATFTTCPFTFKASRAQRPSNREFVPFRTWCPIPYLQ